MIPYESAEARLQIERDLSVSSSEIVGISETNWCVYRYGDKVKCKPTQGLGVLTMRGLILSVYKEDKYQLVRTITAEDINCTHSEGGSGTQSLLYAFADANAYMLAPITPTGQLNVAVKEKYYAYLNSLGAAKHAGKEFNFTKKTGEKETTMAPYAVGNGFIYMPVTEPVYRVRNPCMKRNSTRGN